MLYKPVYLKPKPRELRVEPPEGRPPPVPPPAYWGVPTLKPPPPSPEPGVEKYERAESESEFEDVERLPILIASYKIVIPAEATRDVLAGRVSYLLVDNKGMTVFKPVHVFAALKLKKKTIHHLENYASVGAHERILDSKPIERVGLGYRRKYISPELVGRGIYHPIEPIFRLEDYGAEAVKKQLAMRRLLQTKTLYKPKPFDPEILGRNIFVKLLELRSQKILHHITVAWTSKEMRRGKSRVNLLDAIFQMLVWIGYKNNDVKCKRFLKAFDNRTTLEDIKLYFVSN
ncbi:unnamed protein product [Acanthoscelides obtectus]|uniref:Uncharacterized protein n=1 Tax=Acanthoscelides obtectus TaxID=200917 RepID=A0A9P0M003_ACAOB|nr:unnamed protein product [Acanthoscelides obtectus]CAK1659862.1 hypothetical protein AOBTE_LOCUS21715 [Acanthoscelides obtectus]